MRESKGGREGERERRRERERKAGRESEGGGGGRERGKEAENTMIKQGESTKFLLLSP